ncbi:hypothetical protein D3C85_1762910 [compost metagenome]
MIFAEPMPTLVTLPWLSTTAILESLELHTIVLSAAFAGVKVGVSVTMASFAIEKAV